MNSQRIQGGGTQWSMQSTDLSPAGHPLGPNTMFSPCPPFSFGTLATSSSHSPFLSEAFIFMCKNGDQEENLKEMKIYGEGKNVIKFRSVGRNIQAAVFFFRSAG